MIEIDRKVLAEVIWGASRRDEGTISALGAEMAADAVLAHLTEPILHTGSMLPNSQGVFACECGEVWRPRDGERHSTPKRVAVDLYKPGGKWYTTEWWRVPAGAILPYDMERSPDFHRISGGPVVVVTQEPWGFSHLFPQEVSP